VAPADRIGKTAITYAAGEGHTAIVRLLLDKGVDPNAVYRNDLTVLMWAAGYGKTDTVRALIDAGARLDPVDNRGKTALDMARAVRNLMLQTGATLQDAAAMASSVPARFMNVADKTGAIAAGRRADLILVDDDLNVLRTWIGGREISAA
jgi:ankyrin repeat protein